MPVTAKMQESKSDGVPTAEGAEEVTSSESGNSTVHVKDGESAKKTEPESTKIENEHRATEEKSHQRNEQKDEDIPEEKAEQKTGNNPEQNKDKMGKEADDSAVEKPNTLEGTSNKRTHRFRSDQAARENEEPTATGKEKEKRSGKYEIVSIREKHSNFRKAVPLMPLPLSVFLCLLNVGIPGLGTLFAGTTILCGCKTEHANRGMAVLYNLLAGLLQLILAPLIIGWIWSIMWGLIFVQLSVTKDLQEPTERAEV